MIPATLRGVKRTRETGKLMLIGICTSLLALWLSPHKRLTHSVTCDAPRAPEACINPLCLPHRPHSKATVAQKNDHPAQIAFREWVKDVTSMDPTSSLLSSNPMMIEGLRLAQARHTYMKDLIQHDPDRALSIAIGFADYARLPEPVQLWVEEPFTEMLPIEILPDCSPGAPPSHILLGTSTANQHNVTYGQDHRTAVTKRCLPIQGVRLGNWAAVRAQVFQVVSGEDLAWAEETLPAGFPLERCLTTGMPIDLKKSLTAIAGGKVYRFENEEALRDIESTLTKVDTFPGPDISSGWLDDTAARMEPGEAFPTEEILLAAQTQSLQFTTGTRSAIIIRVDFSDRPGEPADVSTLSNLMNQAIDGAIRSYSYDKANLNALISPQVIRVDQPSSSYLAGNNYNDLYNEAVANYVAAGNSDPEAIYDTVCVYFTDIGYSWAGRASVGGQRMWLDGTTNQGVILHEFGHNFGLQHANYWNFDSSNGSSTNPVDPTGSNEEYGDDFDNMGDGSFNEGHFHVAAKQYLQWIATTEWTDLQNSADNGTYRLYRFDDIDAGNLQALRITKSATADHYWVGYRHTYDNLETFRKGAYLTWERAGGSPARNQCWLVDSTPTTPENKKDAPIVIGRTYSDHTSDLHITPISVGGTTPNEYIDLVVNYGPFGGNAPPTGNLTAPTTAVARTTVQLSVSATDPDSDSLAYYWDLGDGVVQENAALLNTSWSTGGTFQIEVTISDMKGETFTLSQAVVVSDPLTNWVTRTSPSTEDLHGIAANQTYAVAIGDRGTVLRSSDGTSWQSQSLPGFTNNIYLFDACYTGSEFIIVGMDYDFGIAGWVGVIFTSPDGSSWTEAYRASTADTRLLSVAHDPGSGTIIAAGQDSFGVRRFSGNWTAMDTTLSNAKRAFAVTFGEGTFVLVGRNQQSTGNTEVKRSSDGVTWTDHEPGIADWKDYSEVYYNGTRFLAGGWYSQTRFSDDQGQTWATLQTGDRYTIHAYAHGNGINYAVGENRDNQPSPVATDFLSLDDGQNWIPLQPGTVESRNALSFFAHTFISVGDGGEIRQSPAIPATGGFPDWIAAYYTGTEADLMANPDGDWAINLVEYALGSLPNDALSVPPRPIVSVNTNGYLQLDIHRTQNRSDLLYQVEWNHALSGGSWSATPVTILDDTDSLLRVRSNYDQSQQLRQYFRFRLMRP